MGQIGKGSATSSPPVEVGFFLLPEFSLLGLVGAINVMRAANRVSGKAIYRWRTLSSNGAPVRNSDGLVVEVDGRPGRGERPDALFICGGFHPERFRHPDSFKWFRALAGQRRILGAITTGTHVLASAGLLSGYACTIHWDNAAAFAEAFPEIDLRNTLYVIDRDRYTCTGATAAIDMFLHMVVEASGLSVATEIADFLQLDRIRSSDDEQARASKFAIFRRSKKLAAAVATMERAVQVPLDIHTIADEVGLTERQLHRLFRQHTRMSPTEFYRDLRLRRARSLLINSSADIMEAAIACGFSTHSHFTKCYRRRFGHTPSHDRQVS